jgi:hypothetical protein
VCFVVVGGATDGVEMQQVGIAERGVYAEQNPLFANSNKDAAATDNTTAAPVPAPTQEQGMNSSAPSEVILTCAFDRF